MADIGPTLREARMRARMDITELEGQTKIRAKYLRALENEEWDLLPGPTYVKTFLRTYAEALGLDAKMLVEQYKLRFERLSDLERQPIAPSTARTQPRRRAPVPPRGLVIGTVVVALIAALWALGQSTGDDAGTATQTGPPPTATDEGSGEGSGESGDSDEDGGGSSGGGEEADDRPDRLRLRIEATGPAPVYVCLADDDGILVRGEELQPGDRTDTFKAERFRLDLGNNLAKLIINGKRRAVSPDTSLEITRGSGRQALAEDSVPDCS
ncbi:MAG TPA: helix-turn-helix domain-containing protein [Solirubrobacteraceae bacterium]|nr:helix-turn-helix domain-containing protein [Solirubrobacteraceae bacterium]